MLGSLVALCDYRPTRKQENVRGRRLALSTTALRSPPVHRRTAFNEQVSWLFYEKTRVLRRSGVIDRSPSLIFLKSKRATPLLIKISEFDIQHSDNIVYICRTYRNKISRKCSLFSLSEPRKFEKCRE